jgi:hypothetical protein
MNDELPTGESAEDTIEAQEPETAESGTDLAPVTEDKQDKANDGAQKAINKQHAKFREQERIADAEKRRADAAEEKLKAIEAEKGDVTIPDLPDPYDEDYEARITARDEAIKQKAAQDAQRNIVIEQQNANNEAAQRAEQDRISGLVDSYDKNIVKLGLDSTDIKNAVQTIVDYGVDGSVREFILQQEDGPLITKYLADNPLVLDDLRNMSPINAALKIETEIKAAASTLKPQASSAPDPAETLSGRGAGEKVNPLIAGVKFE